MLIKILRPFTLLLILISLAACSETASSGSKKLMILATTGMIGDMVTNLAGDYVEVKTMMGPGVDPHLYKASQGDMELISNADIIVYNGLHLEGKLVDIFEKTGKSKPTIALGEFLPTENILKSENSGEAPDPHIWMNPKLWKIASKGLGDTLSSLMKDHSNEILASEKVFSEKLDKLDSEVDSLISLIEPETRVLITSHDAFRYFGNEFKMEVKGLQGISTVSEYGLRDVKNMVDLIISRKIKAVFVESSVSSKSLESVVQGCRDQGHEVKIGATLYSDSMGEKGTPNGTYFGMIRHNAQSISNALK
ncbi:MAG: zinc ABC transporter substrate-binding protein [Bacteroidia bacterium]